MKCRPKSHEEMIKLHQAEQRAEVSIRVGVQTTTSKPVIMYLRVMIDAKSNFNRAKNWQIMTDDARDWRAEIQLSIICCQSESL